VAASVKAAITAASLRDVMSVPRNVRCLRSEMDNRPEEFLNDPNQEGTMAHEVISHLADEKFCQSVGTECAEPEAAGRVITLLAQGS
jgi:hypothetical protein